MPAQFKIDAMDCSEEVSVLRRELARVVGGEERLSFDILNRKLTVHSDDEDVSRLVVEAVARTGMQAEPWTSTEKQPENGVWLRWRRSLLTTLSGLGLAGGFVCHVMLAENWLDAFGSEGTGHAASVPIPARVLYGIGALAGMATVLPKAWFALRRVRPDINLLMTIAVAGANAIGEWFEAATVAFLFAVSLLLESWSVGRARRAIAALLDLSPPTARVRQPNGEIAELPVEQVELGALVTVRPGERLPVDGVVREGLSSVDQSPITGESRPVDKQPGDAVYAGTINGDATLLVECTRRSQDTTLAQIIRLVDEAQSRRAPSERWVEKFAHIYTPVVIAVALLVLVVPPLLLQQSWEEWLYKSLVLLVIACPCALVISTPVSIVAALAAAARQGVLIKGGVYVEIPARLTALALDKTGTLTRGAPAVVEVVPLNNHTEAELLERALAMESHSDHPLARAIVNYAESRGVSAARAENFQVIQGKGAKAQFDGREFWLGSHRYLEERGQETPDVHQRLESMSAGGRSIVVIGNNEHVCGLIALADEVRPESRATLEELRRVGIQHLIMLTGDNEATARAVAQQTGVDEIEAELLPADKVKTVERLVAKYGSVAMIGDGVNDAPALARATMGVAMGAAGSDAAIETADVALMSDDLSRLPWLIEHSKRALRIIRQNISFSLAVKALFVILTFTGFASLWAAIAADMGASLLVIFNGLRLLRHSEPA